MTKQRRRKTDKPATLIEWFLHHAKDLVAVGVLAAMATAGLTHFATAADVDKKFASLRVELKSVALEARKARLEDELFRLRTDTKQKGTQPQIQRYEAELRDVSARLRDLERSK